MFQGKISIYEAGVRAGIVKRYNSVRRGFSPDDLRAAAQWKPKRQVVVMRDLFEAMPLDAQCTFISQVLDAKLGEHLGNDGATPISNELVRAQRPTRSRCATYIGVDRDQFSGAIT